LIWDYSHKELPKQEKIKNNTNRRRICLLVDQGTQSKTNRFHTITIFFTQHSTKKNISREGQSYGFWLSRSNTIENPCTACTFFRSDFFWDFEKQHMQTGLIWRSMSINSYDEGKRRVFFKFSWLHESRRKQWTTTFSLPFVHIYTRSIYSFYWIALPVLNCSPYKGGVSIVFRSSVII
jgi:hypothetical protein